MWLWIGGLPHGAVVGSKPASVGEAHRGVLCRLWKDLMVPLHKNISGSALRIIP